MKRKYEIQSSLEIIEKFNSLVSEQKSNQHFPFECSVVNENTFKIIPLSKNLNFFSNTAICKIFDECNKSFITLKTLTNNRHRVFYIFAILIGIGFCFLVAENKLITALFITTTTSLFFFLLSLVLNWISATHIRLVFEKYIGAEPRSLFERLILGFSTFLNRLISKQLKMMK